MKEKLLALLSDRAEFFSQWANEVAEAETFDKNEVAQCLERQATLMTRYARYVRDELTMMEE